MRLSDILRSAHQVVRPKSALESDRRPAPAGHGLSGATRYLSGPAVQDDLDLDAFGREGIEVAWMDYRGYPEYPQLWGAFEPSVSVVDLLLNTGDEAPRYLARTAP